MEEFVPIQLPSKCLTYPDVNPEAIRIRPFRGKEEELIAELGIGNPKKKVLEVISSVIQGVDPNILTSGDVSYILLWEGINSYTKLYPLRLVCESCSQSIDVQIDLSNLEVKELPDDFKQPMEISLSNTKVNLRLLTLKDDIAAYNYLNEFQSVYLYTFALSIVDKNMKTLDRVRILEEMSTQDLAKIRGFHEKYEHGPNFSTEYKCPKCGEKGRVLIPFRLDSLIPVVSQP